MTARDGSGDGSVAALRVRVDNLADDVHAFRAEMRDVRAAISGEIAAISNKLDSGAKPNWQAWGVAISAVIALGTLAYWPILRSVDENRSTILELSKYTQVNTIDRSEFQAYQEGVKQTFEERKLAIGRNASDIQGLLIERLANAKDVAASKARVEELEKRISALSVQIQRHLRPDKETK